LQSNKLKLFSSKQIREGLKENPNTQKKYMAELQLYGYVRKKDGDKKKGFSYEVVSSDEYQQLQQQIHNALDEVLSKLQQQAKKKGK
jgi:transcription initiation factor IIE alpha subunit